jgi:integrase
MRGRPKLNRGLARKKAYRRHKLVLTMGSSSLVQSNPMRLVRVKDVSKRVERPSVLTAEEFHKVLPHVREPYRTMVLIAGCLGLRAGEIVGLQWADFDFDKLTQ